MFDLDKTIMQIEASRRAKLDNAEKIAFQHNWNAQQLADEKEEIRCLASDARAAARLVAGFIK